jgi:hypothetical protein
MDAQQPKQFRRSKLRRISAVGELISGRDSKAFQNGRRSDREPRADDNAVERSRVIRRNAPAGHLCMLIFSEIHASRVVHDGTVGVPEQFFGTFKQDGV